jgi:serine-type D-Ala-D-Ala carboxypeptidase (penicillin-binding protein 5/6)
MLTRIALSFLMILAAAFADGKSAIAQSVQTAAPIAYLYDVNTRSPLFEKGADELFPPASIVKLLTAETVFAALKEGRITPQTDYPITEDVWRRGGAPSRGAAMFAPLNSRIAVSDLLQGLIVMSANDAALALAAGLGGSEAAFVTRMQERAKAIGLTRSQIRNATGFAHPEQMVSAREMAKLALHIIETYPESYPLFGQREFTWNAIRQTNRNPLLAMNIGADGMKTGNIGDAGFGLVGSAVQNGRRLIVVIMGADSAQTRAADARKLLEWGFSNFERRKLLDKQVPLTEAKVTGGIAPTVTLGLKEDVELLLPKSALDVVQTRIQYLTPLKAPVEKGAEVGRLTVTRAGAMALDVPIIALDEVAQGSLGKRALDNSWEWFLNLFRRGGVKT